jgi:Domain of unknown function (DUF3560)
MLAHLITGNTYPHRRVIRVAGGIWNANRKGYLIRADHLPRIAKLIDLGEVTAAAIEVEAEAFAPLTPDALRAYRAAKVECRRQRLFDRAAAADRRAAEAAARISPHEREFLRLGEPVKIGHHSERRHRRLIERADRASMDQGRELSKADDLRHAAQWLQPACVKGDAEAARQSQRDAAAAMITPGDVVRNPIYGEGVVTKANAKTFTVSFVDRGFVQTCDKAHVSLVRKGDLAALPACKFKAGDLVIARRLMATYEGIVKRRTARGYAVEYETFGKRRTETFSESSLTLRAADDPAQAVA